MNTDPVAVKLRSISEAQMRVSESIETLRKAFTRDLCVHQTEIDALQAAHNALVRIVSA